MRVVSSLRLPVRQKRVPEFVLFGLVPILMVALFTIGVARATFAWDFHPSWEAAARLIHGDHDLYAPSHASNSDGRPYGTYIYPPTLAILLAPLGLLSFGFASSLFIGGSIGAVVGSLALLGVRDWRCYGIVFLWVPVLGNIRLANITAILLFGIALSWRFRHRSRISGSLLALLIVLKLFLWPLFAWELRGSVRRLVVTVGTASAIVVASWSAVAFVGLVHYPTVLRRFESFWQSRGYGFSPALRVVGVSPGVAGLLLSSIALLSTLVVAMLIVRGVIDDRQSLTLLIAVALVFSPVSWLHYATLLIVPIALSSPSLTWQWFLPLALWASPLEEADGSAWRLTLFSLVVVATTIGAVRASSRGRLSHPLASATEPPESSGRNPTYLRRASIFMRDSTRRTLTRGSAW